jgi:hypothetical protein
MIGFAAVVAGCNHLQLLVFARKYMITDFCLVYGNNIYICGVQIGLAVLF